MDCKSLSRAREKPTPRHPRPPRQVRRTADLRGNAILAEESLNPNAAEMLQERNDSRRFNFQVVDTVVEMNQDSFPHVHVQENPANLLLWHSSELQLQGLKDLEANHTPRGFPWMYPNESEQRDTRNGG